MERRHEMALIAAAARALRATRARLHFRSAVRLTYENHHWLEDTEGEQLGMNVARNIQILTRKKQKGQLALTEKAIMRVALSQRTESEKAHLRKVLGTLKCFRKYPAEVKDELTAITNFAVYEPERVIVRQGDPAVAIYFVVSGSARVVTTDFDPVTHTMEDVTVKVEEAGDLFGELALILGSNRTATIITNECSEFLILHRDDFDRVLRDTVKQEWDEIKKAISLFDYFKFWDDSYILQSCMISKMRSYEVNDVILSEHYGNPKYVYFVTEGIVDLIECVDMKVFSYKNEKVYSLHDSHFEKNTRRVISETGRRGRRLREKLMEMKSLSHFKLGGNASFRGSDIPGYSTSAIVMEKKKKREKIPDEKMMFGSEFTNTNFMQGMDPAKRVQLVKKYESQRSRVTCPKDKATTEVETHFIRVAIMKKLATFNVGEHLESRYYVAKSKVKLLAIPQYWLFSSDKATWNNILIVLRNRLPTRENLFEEFLRKRKWMEFRKECYHHIADQTKKTNMNNMNNVPYSIRLEGDLDYYVLCQPLLDHTKYTIPRTSIARKSTARPSVTSETRASVARASVPRTSLAPTSEQRASVPRTSFAGTSEARTNDARTSFTRRSVVRTSFAKTSLERTSRQNR